VVCPSIKPELVVISNDSSTSVDFGSISIGHSCVKSITIQNISDNVLNVKNRFFFGFFFIQKRLI
jgi:hypothetical protein